MFIAQNYQAVRIFQEYQKPIFNFQYFDIYDTDVRNDANTKTDWCIITNRFGI